MNGVCACKQGAALSTAPSAWQRLRLGAIWILSAVDGECFYRQGRADSTSISVRDVKSVSRQVLQRRPAAA